MTGDRFLQAFYTHPNLSYEQVTREYAERFRYSLQAVREGCSVPAFLPVRRVPGEPYRWYGVLEPTRPYRELEEVARTAVAPSLGSITTRTVLPGPDGRLEEQLEETFARSWLRIELRSDNDVRQAVRAALERQVRNLLRRPAIELSLSRTVARIRADIDLAITESDAAAVDRLLQELSVVPTVTAENRLYVTIDGYSRLGRHQALLELEDLDRIVQSRPPRPVRLALLTSLRSVLTLEERTPDDLQQLPASVGPLLAELLEQAPPPATVAQVEALLAANVLASTAGQPPWATPRYLLAQLQDLGGDPAPWQDRFAAEEVVSGADDDPIGLLRARAARAATVQDVRRIVGEALVVGTSDAAAIAARSVEERAPELRSDRLIGEVVRRLEAFANADDNPPTSWYDWITWCATGEERPEARDVVEENAAAWGPIIGDEIELLTLTMTDPTTVTAQNLRSTLGLLMEHLGAERGTPRRGPLLRAAIQLLAHGGPTSHDERQATMAWVEELCADGVDGPAYTALLEHLEEIWRQVASVGTAEWIIDLLAILVVAPAAPGEASAARQSFLHRVFPQVRNWATALDDEARDTLVRTADLVGIEVHGIATTDARSDPLSALQNRSLGIHTLMRSSALTCVAAIRRVAPDCQIEINDDHVATDQLAALAANADVFALVTGASKHEASRAVERHRPAGKPLVRVHGKGATMLLRELRAAVAEDSTSVA